MWWHFRDRRIGATDSEIAALHLADYSPDFLATPRHEFYLMGRPPALNASSITVQCSVRVSP
jgi:hypothetical protein